MNILKEHRQDYRDSLNRAKVALKYRYKVVCVIIFIGLNRAKVALKLAFISITLSVFFSLNRAKVALKF